MRGMLLLALLVFGVTAPAVAASAGQTARSQAAADEFSAQSRIRPIATRIEVYPSTRRVRRCVDWYQIEYRPSGRVLTPQMRCWWANR